MPFSSYNTHDIEYGNSLILQTHYPHLNFNDSRSTFFRLLCLFTDLSQKFRTRLNRGQAIGVEIKKIWKNHSIPISTKIRLMKALVWPVATYGCKS